MAIPDLPFGDVEVPTKNTFVSYEVKHWSVPAALHRQRTWPCLHSVEELQKLKPLELKKAKEENSAADVSPGGSWEMVSHKPAKRGGWRSKADAAPREQVITVKEDGPVHLQWSSPVGIDDDSSFRVVRRLLGPGGERMKAVSKASEGAKVWLQGRGARLGAADRGCAEPLELCVHAVTRSSFNKAVVQAQALLVEVHEEHRAFISKAATLSQKKSKAHEQAKATSSPRPTPLAGASTPALRGNWSRPSYEKAAAKFERCLNVGIEEDSHFRVVRRLLGPRGENMQYITKEANREHPGANVKASIRGRGVHRSQGDRGDDSAAPLAVWLTASSKDALECAVEMAEELVQDVRAAHKSFSKRSGHWG